MAAAGSEAAGAACRRHLLGNPAPASAPLLAACCGGPSRLLSSAASWSCMGGSGMESPPAPAAGPEEATAPAVASAFKSSTS